MLFDFTDEIIRCAQQVAPITMLAIIQTESRGNLLAIGLNKGKKLRYQAHTLVQATAWVDYLEQRKYDFDIGLAQVNIMNVHKYGYKAHDMLDPCTNLRVASQILYQNYRRALDVSSSRNGALLMALSAYNSGDFHKGFSNGYVFRIVANAKTIYSQ